MMMPPTSDLALHLATLRSLDEARAAMQQRNEAPAMPRSRAQTQPHDNIANYPNSARGAPPAGFFFV